MKELPIGVQTFEDIVSGNYYYVDKTGMIHQLANKFRYVFLSRPRRFGKSLLSSTFHSYFAGERELFDGLEAGKLETEWVKHPVFHFDMSTAKHMNEEQLLGEMRQSLLCWTRARLPKSAHITNCSKRRAYIIIS